MPRTRVAALAVACITLTAFSAGLAPSGPPMVCLEVKIGEAKSLPLTTGALSGERLTRETLALLEPETTALVRMETLRRALLQGGDDNATLTRLLTSLQARVLDQEARGRHDPLAWFDAGYFLAAWRQLDHEDAPEVGLSEGCVGYAWIRKAMTLANNPPEMEFAAALATHPAMHKGTHQIYERHLARAAAGAAAGSLLEQNVREHCRIWEQPYEELNRKGGQTRDDGGRR